MLIPRAYIHRHDVYKQQGFAQEESKEVKLIMDRLSEMIINFNIETKVSLL